MSNQPIYTQEGLNNRNFRLLHIHPASDKRKRLRCTTRTFDIDNAPAYEALSYVWGPTQRHHKIICNKQVIGIQPSLAIALRRLRLRRKSRVIWADAICINQDDNVEKSHQVPMMGSIYSKAERVVVWLGAGNPQETTTAFGAVQYVAKACCQYKRDRGLDDRRVPDKYRELDLPKEAFSFSTVASLQKLFARPWFSRIWCVQEIQLARDALVLWGQDEIFWEDFAMGASWICDKDPETLVWNKNDSMISSYLYLAASNAARMGRKMTKTLLEALETYRQFQATNPRDKVYGLLNLISSESERDMIEVDYDKSVGQIFADTALSIIQLYSQLSILGHVEHSEHYASEEVGDQDEDLIGKDREDDDEESERDCEDYEKTCRSWAPLWSDSTRIDILGRWNCPWRPCGQGISSVTRMCVADAGQFVLRGILYEKVREVEVAMNFYGQSLPNLFLNIHTRLGSEHISYDEQGGIRRPLDVLARSMTAGQWRRHHLEEVDTVEHKRYYQAFRHVISRASEIQRTGDEGDFQHNADSKEFEEDTELTCRKRRMFWTENNSLGLGPQCMRAGDVVAVLHGGNTPYVLRPRGDKFLFMGQAYVDEIMDGLLMEKLGRGEVQEQDFCLI